MTTVTVVYDGGLDSDLDRRLRRLAGFQGGVELGGVELGSRSMLDVSYSRDLAFIFVTVYRAQRFTAAVQRAVAHDYPNKKVRVVPWPGQR